MLQYLSNKKVYTSKSPQLKKKERFNSQSKGLIPKVLYTVVDKYHFFLGGGGGGGLESPK